MSPPSFRIQIYRGRKRLRQVWRWRAIALNGNIIANGGEAYGNRGDAAHIVARLFPGADVMTEQ